MKKVLFGCLGVLVVAAVAGAIGGYYFVYKPAKTYVQSFSQLQELPKLDAQVRNTAAFTMPDNGELTPALVDRFVAVQRDVQAKLGKRLGDLDAKYKTLSDENGGQPSVTDGLAALKDLGTLIVEAKRVQVEALNAHGFSVAEYDWARRSIYAAASIPMSANFEGVVKAASSGQAPTADSLSEAVIGEVPEANRTLVAPHVELLQKNAALAFFGL